MSDTHVAYLVTLEEPARNSDAWDTLTALRRIKGVCSVEPVGDELDMQMAKSALRPKAITELLAAVARVFG